MVLEREGEKERKREREREMRVTNFFNIKVAQH
jgi:hypothetical protein